jgi:hypothetical protein
MLRFAGIESSFKPNARTGSYKGLYQLSTEEFRRHGGGNIFDPEDNARAFAKLLKRNAMEYEAKTGQPATGPVLYLLHQQGTAGGAKHLANPERPAWQNMLATSEGRRKGARWAKKAIWGNVPAQQKRQFGSVERVTSGQFVNMWNARYAREGDPRAGSTMTAFDPNAARVPPTPGRSDKLPVRTAYMQQAEDELKLNPAERALYRRHLTNLHGKGGVDNEDGTRSTLYQTTVQLGNKTYLIPTVWDGKVLPVREAVDRVRQVGWDKFPAYATLAEAEKRYDQLHTYMQLDTKQYEQNRLAAAAATPSAEANPAGDVGSPAQASYRLPASPEDSPEEPGPVAISADRPRRAGRLVRQGEESRGGFSPELAEQAFGSPFGELYSRPDQGDTSGVPRAPLLRDIFG